MLGHLVDLKKVVIAHVILSLSTSARLGESNHLLPHRTYRPGLKVQSGVPVGHLDVRDVVAGLGDNRGVPIGHPDVRDVVAGLGDNRGVPIGHPDVLVGVIVVLQGVVQGVVQGVGGVPPVGAKSIVG